MRALRSLARPLIASGVVLALVAACSSSGTAPTSSADSAATPIPPLVTSATPSLTAAQPSPADSAAPEATDDAEPTPKPIVVDLATTAGQPTHIEVIDWTGMLSGATSGSPGEGASIEPGTLQLRNDLDTSLRITWSAAPCATADRLYLEPGLARITLLSPPCEGDAIPLDRVLVLYFSQPVDSDAIEAVVQTSVDTTG